MNANEQAPPPPNDEQENAPPQQEEKLPDDQSTQPPTVEQPAQEQPQEAQEQEVTIPQEIEEPTVELPQEPSIETKEEEPLQETEEVPFSEEKKEPTIAPEQVEVEKEVPKPSEEPTIDFSFLETESRWLIKVIAGPNSGAEFALHGGSSYLIGTDASQCDIIFHDMSISRRHAKIIIDSKENASIEDVDSRNGLFVDGQKVTSCPIKSNVMVTIGTTTFAMIDRTQEQKTIFAPKTAPQASKEEKVVPKEEPQTIDTEMKPIREAAIVSLQTEVEKIKEEAGVSGPKKLKKLLHTLYLSAIIGGILLAIGFGATALFRTEMVKKESVHNPQELISQALKDFPAVRFSYNPSTKHLLLVGHVLSAEDQTRMLDTIQQLPFVSEINSSGVVIDEFVWREMNQILAKNPAWRGITVTSPEPGKFILSGFLQTRAMGEELLAYLSQNFAYMNLLEQKVVIEEDLISEIKKDLNQAGCQGVKASMNNGELILTGAVSYDKKEAFDRLLEKFKTLAGVRAVVSQVIQSGEAQAVVDLSDKYRITGYSQQKGNVSVVVNGRILGRGDILDGMLIVDITATTIFLEHDGVTYKIDYIK